MFKYPKKLYSFMCLVERCTHQFSSPVWKSCETCAWDQENNKKCPAYSPMVYEIREKRIEDNTPKESNLTITYSIATSKENNSNLNQATA